jgi:hypothetical protein
MGHMDCLHCIHAWHPITYPHLGQMMQQQNNAGISSLQDIDA